MKLYILIPMLNEFDNIESLLSDIEGQSHTNFKCYFCINQPESWYEDESKKEQIDNNQNTISYLQKHCDFEFEIIDRSSKGLGWNKKNFGVGMARKVLIDTASMVANPEDIMISLDADTHFHTSYFESIYQNFQSKKDFDVISVPYFHPLSGDNSIDRAILRYEIYMRYYALNLWRINSPYHYTALGSAIAFRNSSCKKIGGMTPKKSGEDFYFLQKMVKYKPILHWNAEKVYPQARLSDRVFFGTGPALIKGCDGDWNSYPIYDYRLFDKITETYNYIPKLYTDNVETALDSYLHSDINELWKKLRDNVKSYKQFERAVHEKIDGLRILQFLKAEQEKNLQQTEEQKLLDYIQTFYATYPSEIFNEDFNFETSSIDQLNQIRIFLASEEDKLQKAEYEKS